MIRKRKNQLLSGDLICNDLTKNFEKLFQTEVALKTGRDKLFPENADVTEFKDFISAE